MAMANGQAALADLVENQLVPFGQTGLGELEPTQAVVLVGVGARQVDHQVGLAPGKHRAEGGLQGGEVSVVGGAVGQFHVQVAALLVEGVVAGAMDAEGEALWPVGQDGGGAVALVHVAVDDRHPLDPALGAHGQGGDGGVVEDTEAFAPVAEGVVGAAGQVGGAAVLQRRPAGRQGGAGGAAGALHHGLRPGKADAPDIVPVEGAADNPLHVACIVGAEQFGIAGGVGNVEVVSAEKPPIPSGAPAGGRIFPSESDAPREGAGRSGRRRKVSFG
jgi:hypothetical protein